MLPGILGRFAPDVALDLGTANTLLGVPGEGIVVDEPSIVAVAETGQGVLARGSAVGHLARQMFGRTSTAIQVVRPLADGAIRDYALCESMLRCLLEKVRRGGWSLRPRVLVAVPGSSTPVEKRAVYSSLHRAGARSVLLVPEALAAAIGAGLPVAEPVASLICDIGGGTTEAAVVSLGDVVASTSIRVGGDRMDQAVVDHLRRSYSLRIGPAEAERLRIEIGSAAPLIEELVDEVRGVDAVSGLPRKATITSEEVRQALAEPLAQIVDCLRATLDQTPPELAADLVDHGLTLCGGGALLRNIDRFLGDQMGLPTRVVVEPLTTVVRGALACLEDLPAWRGVLESSDHAA
ncbi:MAG: rod shape-determining protein [Pirellulales bacterium]|nr:rod shape-determining protein [Pirellulales bacterium]